MDHKKCYRWLIQQSNVARTTLYFSRFLGIFSGIVIILQAFILSTIIDQVYLHAATRHQLIRYLLIFLGLALLRAIITYAREHTGFQSAKLVKDYVRKNVFQQVMQYTIPQLSTHKTGALVSVLIEQVDALQNFFADYLPQITIIAILPLIILLIVFKENWIAGLTLLITGPLIPLFMALIGMGVASLNQRNFQALSIMSAHFLDRLQGLTTLTLFNRARAETKSVEIVSDHFRQSTMKVLRVAFLSSGALELFATISIAMIAVYLGLGLLGLVHIGFDGVHITLQHALFILLLAPEFFMPLRQLGVFYHARAEAIGASAEIIKLTDADIKKIPVKNLREFSEKKIDLHIKDLCFSYDNKKIFDHFEADFPFGQLIVLTGNSGTGKSTLLKLIAKLLTPQFGEIFADKIPLSLIEDDDWRDNIAFLQQHARLFFGTLHDNIIMGNKKANAEQIKSAAKTAGVFEFTDDLLMRVGEQNTGLSGGQIQRVAIARIILKDAPIVLLDEPTNYLDTNNVDIILNLLSEWKGKKTVIVATHDQRIFEQADQAIVLNYQ